MAGDDKKNNLEALLLEQRNYKKRKLNVLKHRMKNFNQTFKLFWLIYILIYNDLHNNITLRITKLYHCLKYLLVFSQCLTVDTFVPTGTRNYIIRFDLRFFFYTKLIINV